MRGNCETCAHEDLGANEWTCYRCSAPNGHSLWEPKPEPVTEPTVENEPKPSPDAEMRNLKLSLPASGERPSFQAIYMNMAHELAKRSTCSRLQVGTVITSADFRKVLAVGYNGNAAGLPNRCDRDEPGNCGCLHSEENAIINCDAPRETPKLVFCTHLPCVMCAKRLINLGNARTVYYAQDYRKRDAIDLFARAGINVALIGGWK